MYIYTRMTELPGLPQHYHRRLSRDPETGARPQIGCDLGTATTARSPNKQRAISHAKAAPPEPRRRQRTQANAKMPGRERVTAYNRSAMKPLPSPRMGGKSDTLFAMTSPPVRRVLFDDKPKGPRLEGDNFTEPLWREGPTDRGGAAGSITGRAGRRSAEGRREGGHLRGSGGGRAGGGDDDLDAVNDLPLHRACEDGDTQRARKCLDEGANVVETDENGCCALFLAAERAHVDCMRLLLQHGAGVDQAANHGATPS